MEANKMSSIIFLFLNERFSERRETIWDTFIQASGAEYLNNATQIIATPPTCIFTHSGEYRAEISTILGNIGDIPVVVFSGGEDSIRVDNTREATFWMPISMINPIDGLFGELLTTIKNGANVSEVLELIRELARSTFPETLTAAYLLLVAQEKNIAVPLKFLSDEQWDEACKQYREIGGEVDADWNKAPEWNKVEAGLVKKKIGELFSQVAFQT
jgi:hypothetical protein